MEPFDSDATLLGADVGRTVDAELPLRDGYSRGSEGVLPIGIETFGVLDVVNLSKSVDLEGTAGLRLTAQARTHHY